MSNDDGLILNIIASKPDQIANKKKQPHAKSYQGRKLLKKQKEKINDQKGKIFEDKNPAEPVDISKKKHKVSLVDNGNENKEKKDSTKENLLPRSKKISKVGVKKSGNVNKSKNIKSNVELSGKDFEEIFHIDEKKDDDGDIFTNNKFSDLTSLDPHLIQILEANNFKTLTKIQKKSLSIVLKHFNCIIKSETGSGKTLAYLVPLIQHLISREKKVSRDDGSFAFIICPTRELCIQVIETANLLIKRFVNIIPGTIMGGEAIKKEKARLRKGINILAATPGRLLYHLKNTKSLKYDSLTHLIFEESDRTLDMGFKKDLDEIIDLLEKKINMNQIQKLLISANLTSKVEALWTKLAPEKFKLIGFDEKITENPKETFEDNLEEDSKFKIPNKLNQKYVLIEESKRISFLLSMLIFSRKSKTMIFVSTTDEADYLEFLFTNLKHAPETQDGSSITDKMITNEIFKLHGKIPQKDRSDTYLKFKKSTSGILICTDVASRGLDFEDVKLIIQLDAPSSIIDYVNRIGRTARINNYGMSLLFLTYTELKYIEKLDQKGIKVERYDEEEYYQYLNAMINKGKSTQREAHSYINEQIKNLLSLDKTNHLKARRAYVSYLRAYGHFKDKEIFHPKKLNLKQLAKSFGLGNVKSKGNETKAQAYKNLDVMEEKFSKWKESHPAKQRKVARTKDIEKMEFM